MRLPQLAKKTAESFASARVAEWVAFFSVLVAVTGVTYWDRRFVKLSVARIYVLEWLFLLWAIAATVANSRLWVRALRYAPWVVCFSAWGAIRAVFDLPQVTGENFDRFAFLRFAQHALIFVYPLIWTIVGIWTYLNRKEMAYAIALTVLAINLVQSLMSVAGMSVWPKASVGTLALLPLLYLAHTLWAGSKRPSPWRVAGVVVFLILSYAPYWNLWLQGVRRTAVLTLAVTLVAAPWAMPRARPLRALAISALAGLIFVSGVVGLVWSRHASLSAVAPAVVSSLQHPEDRPTGEQKKNFQARTRSFLWKRALEDWKAHPIVGVGFVPEIPSEWAPGRRNDGSHIYSVYPGFKGDPAPAISGPHNSYLSILARMGIGGAVLFACAMLAWGIQVPAMARASDPILFRLMAIFIPIAGAVYALFNIGFESPHNGMLLWLFSGVGLACANAKTKLGK